MLKISGCCVSSLRTCFLNVRSPVTLAPEILCLSYTTGHTHIPLPLTNLVSTKQPRLDDIRFSYHYIVPRTRIGRRWWTGHFFTTTEHRICPKSPERIPKQNQNSVVVPDFSVTAAYSCPDRLTRDFYMNPKTTTCTHRESQQGSDQTPKNQSPSLGGDCRVKIIASLVIVVKVRMRLVVVVPLM